MGPFGGRGMTAMSMGLRECSFDPWLPWFPWSMSIFFYVNRKALVPDPAVFSRPFFPDELGLPQVGSRVSASDQSVSDVLWSSILSPYIEQIGDGHGCGELPFFCWQHLKILSLM